MLQRSWWGRVLLVLCILNALYALHLTLRHSLLVRFAGIEIRAHDPWRPALFALGCGVIAYWLARRNRRASALDSSPRVVIAPAPVAIERSRYSSIAFWACAGLVVVGLLAWCVTALQSTPPVYPNGDGALLELYTVHAIRGVFGLGPYSRFGWHHPGPSYFYASAPFYLASGKHHLALNAAAFAINFGCLVLIVWTVCRYAGAALGLAVLSSLSIYIYRLSPTLLTNEWNPNVLILPFATVLVLAPMAAAGHVAVLPLLALVASFVAQTHVGLVPCVVGVSAVAAFVGVRSNGWRASRVAIASTIAVIAIVWFPPIYNELTTTDHNLTQLLRFFAGDTAEPVFAFPVALACWSMMMTAFAAPNLHLPWGVGLPLNDSTWLAVAAIAQIPLLWICGRWAARRGRSLEAWYCRSYALTSVLALVSIARARGGLADHIVFWVSVIGVCNVAGLAAVAALWIRERWHVTGSPALSRFVVPAAAFVMLLVVVAVGARDLDGLRIGAEKTVNHLPPDGTYYQATRQMLAKVHARKPRLHLVGDAWAPVAGIALQLAKKQYPVSLDHPSAWMYGGAIIDEMGDEDVDVTVTDDRNREDLLKRPDDCMIVERAGHSVHVLAVPPERFAGITCLR
jgi:hypothetical protein